MEKEGLVKKVNDLDRKNLVRVELTVRGQKVYNHAFKRAVIHRIMSSLSEEEGQQLSSCLEKLRSSTFSELGLKKRITCLGYEK